MAEGIPREQIINNPLALFTITFNSPFEYQKRLLLSKSRKITFRSARQIGKTTVIAGKALHHALHPEYYFDEPIEPLVLCVAPSERQSNHIFTMIRRAIRKQLISDRVIKETANEIQITNTQGTISTIVVLPGGNPKTITGFSPTLLIIDEAAELKEETFIEILPSLRFTKGYLIFISTPHGKIGRFYQSFQDDDFEKFHVRSIDCPVNDPEELEKERLKMTDMEYQRMVLGEFVEVMDTFFKRDQILDCVSDYKLPEAPVDKCEYYLGVDCARYGLDETVYVVLEHNHLGNLRVVFLGSTPKNDIEDIIGRTRFLVSKWDVKTVYLDSSGLGAGAFDLLKAKGINVRDIEGTQRGVQFTVQNKAEMYQNLKWLIEQNYYMVDEQKVLKESKKIKFFQHDKLVSQLSDLQYKYTESGTPKIHHPETPNSHDDFPDALALACLGVRRISGTKGRFII